MTTSPDRKEDDENVLADVHGAQTVPPPDGGDAYSDATVVRDVPAEMLAATEPEEQKLGALLSPRSTAPNFAAPRPAFAGTELGPTGLPLAYDDEDDSEMPTSSPLVAPTALAAGDGSIDTGVRADTNHSVAATTRDTEKRRRWLIALAFAAAIVVWILVFLK